MFSQHGRQNAWPASLRQRNQTKHLANEDQHPGIYVNSKTRELKMEGILRQFETKTQQIIKGKHMI